jgi:hypothetical protein
MSADGRWWWDGQRWVPDWEWGRYQQRSAPAEPAGERRRKRRLPWIAIGGVALLIGLTLWSGELPRI